MQPDDRLKVAGAVCIAGTARTPDGVPGVAKEDFGVAVSGDGHSLFVSPMDQHSAVCSVSYLAPRPRTPVRGDGAARQADDIMDEALERGRIFSEPFSTFVKATDPETLMVFHAIDKQPIEHSQLPTRNVVFIGEAKHAVSPFAANGANVALIGGVDLAEELVKAFNIVSALKASDAKSMRRSKGAIQQSHFAIMVGHSHGWA